MHAETCAHVAACTCSFNGRGLRSNVNARAPAHPGVHTLLCNAKHVRLVCMRIFQRAEALDSHAAACAHAHTHTHTHTHTYTNFTCAQPSTVGPPPKTDESVAAAAVSRFQNQVKAAAATSGQSAGDDKVG